VIDLDPGATSDLFSSSRRLSVDKFLSPRDTKDKPPSLLNREDLLTRNMSELVIYATSRFRAAEVVFTVNLSSTSTIVQATKEVSFRRRLTKMFRRFA